MSKLGTRVEGLSMIAAFTAVAGIGAVVGAAIAAPALVPIFGAAAACSVAVSLASRLSANRLSIDFFEPHHSKGNTLDMDALRGGFKFFAIAAGLATGVAALAFPPLVTVFGAAAAGLATSSVVSGTADLFGDVFKYPQSSPEPYKTFRRGSLPRE